MGGDIRVESEQGMGAEFTVTLPSAALSTDRPPHGKLPVAVVLASSEQLAGRITTELSGKARVVATADAARVAALARSESPDTVVLDATAPELGPGAHSARCKRTRVLRACVPASWRGMARRMDALDLGTFHAIAKPISLERVAEVIGRSRKHR